MRRAVLALLLTAPNAVWSTDRIIDGVWGDDVGADRQNALWVDISGLRTALEPDREKRAEGTVLVTRSPGYLLDVDPNEIDAVRFERLIAEGRSLLDTDPAATSLSSVRRSPRGGVGPTRTSPTRPSHRMRSPVSTGCGWRRSRLASTPICCGGCRASRSRSSRRSSASIPCRSDSPAS